MRKFLHKKWLSIPVIVVLVLAITAGSVMAAYSFLTTTLQAEVVEAIAVGVYPDWDNLEPYGSGNLSDVELAVDEFGNFTITTAAETPYVGEGFCPGEWIVIPVNIRNGSEGALNLSASASGGGGNLLLAYTWEVNGGNVGTLTEESGQTMCRDYKAVEEWAPLSEWSAVIEGYGGKSGSAVVGATILFVKVSVPGDATPGTYTASVTLNRY